MARGSRMSLLGLALLFLFHTGAHGYTVTRRAAVEDGGLDRLDALLGVLADRPAAAGAGGQAVATQAQALRQKIQNMKARAAQAHPVPSSAAAAAGSAGHRTGPAMAQLDPTLDSYALDVAQLLAQPGAKAALASDPSAIPPEFEVAPANRTEFCAQLRKAGKASQEAINCVCDVPYAPWPHCSALVYLDYSQLYESSAAQNQVPVPPQQIKSAGRKLLAAQLQSRINTLIPLARQAQADVDQVSPFVNKGRQLSQTCDLKSLKQIILGLDSGCFTGSCSFPLGELPLAFRVGFAGCLPLLELANGAINSCLDGTCVRLLLGKDQDWGAEPLAILTNFAESTKVEVSLAVCLQTAPFNELLEAVGIGDACVTLLQMDMYPIMQQFTLGFQLSLLIPYAGFRGRLQLADGSTALPCKYVKELWSEQAYEKYMQCRSYCAWSEGDGDFEFYAGAHFLFWSKEWSWEIVGTPVPACSS